MNAQKPFFQRQLTGVVLALTISWLATSGSGQTVYENYTFTTIAGLPESGPGWFDGTSNTARFDYPEGAALDAAGNLYVADNDNNTIRKISPSGDVTTVAGLAGAIGTNDDIGGNARFNGPESVAVDTNGYVYVADTGNDTIRKITPAGQVTTLAGSAGVSGTNDGTGSAALFNSPNGIAVDGGGNIYVGDYNNETIRKITPAGMVSTFAGSPGESGTNNGTGSGARFSQPSRVAVDRGGNVYVSDTANETIRKITPAGVVSTLAGLPTFLGSMDGTGSAARFNQPFGVAVDAATNVYVTDSGNYTIRKITPAGVVTTFAGTAGVQGITNGTGPAARFYDPSGIAVDSGTNLYVADTFNHFIRKISPAAVVTTLTGAPLSPGTNNGVGNVARFNFPEHLACDTSNNIFIADVGNHVIRKILATGVVTNVAGLAGTAGMNNGTGSAARFDYPNGVAVDGAGNAYVADTGNNAIRKITPAGVVTTLAGLPGTSGTNNGTGTAARFDSPAQVALDKATNVYVADNLNHAVRKITPAGVVTTLAGLPGISGTNDGVGTAARFNQPFGLIVDSATNVYVADSANHTIRKITPAGMVTTIAGEPGISGTNDAATGAAAHFLYPVDVAVDASNNLFVAEYSNDDLRKITPAGVVTTLGGKPGFTGNANGSGGDARFYYPFGVAVDATGTLYVGDYGNHVIRKGVPALPDVPVVDRPNDLTGIPRQLDVSNLTTTSWSWSLIRRPASSAALLSSGSARNPTFTPDRVDQYKFRLTATNAAGAVAIGTVQLSGLAGLLTVNLMNPNNSTAVIGGSGGPPGGNFSVLATPNVSLPASQWTTLASGNFDANGNFNSTNAVNPGDVTRFYQIRAP